ncbi:hypothetical protein CDD81_2497 [Ophiocordyceps australis]|uniref:Uncharacterized protein n=1 Tax=Ophiocordyceps australis TaxID=1399860 RepID=A0A2C5YCP2_9HYPO|nr:hypothetical protein CDD81_2497 [Ophiocordyceps australis]
MAARASAPDVATVMTPPHSLSNKHQSDPPPAGPTAPKATTCTPPPSPTTLDAVAQSSLLYPPHGYSRIDADALSVYELNAEQVASALDYAARQPLPPPSSVFPWLHGLHPDNQLQQAFFAGHSSTPATIPVCLRGVVLVKADGQLDVACLKGAIAPNHFMRPGTPTEFINADPPDGFSVRNFQIQPAKMALTSDIIVYDAQNPDEARKLAWDIAAAQLHWRDQHAHKGHNLPRFHTFVCTSTMSEFEQRHPNLVSIDATGTATGKVLSFSQQERNEMWNMAEASQISFNVYMGPTPEPGSSEEESFDMLVECSDLGRLNPSALRSLVEDPNGENLGRISLDFPSSGSILPPAWSHEEADGILETCRWLFHLAHGTCPDVQHSHGLPQSRSPATPTVRQRRPRKILIHCTDGYTESTLLGIAYLSYSAGIPVPEAWLRLHTCKHRDFFAYPTDVALLTAIAPRLLQESPASAGRSFRDITNMVKDEPRWLQGLDGSLPSRILKYLYLGNLGHANNPHLLANLGIRQVLSVGETALWRDGDRDEWGAENICVVQGVQDNGIDSLTDHFARCLEFIDRGRRNGTATLVHCRVGVSRSATICIAEVMRSLNLSFPRAYCFVRARRLNVIIQPHLRFVYELLRWEEHLRQTNSSYTPTQREMEWGEIAHEIALINRPYSR